MNPRACPKCGNTDTDRQATMPEGDDDDVLLVVRTCHDCITQFTVEYEAVEKTVDVTEADA